jgi:arylsulfatase A-like enzyme
MTGLWPHTTGCTSNGSVLDPKFKVLPQLIQDRDYRTAYMGKWHLGSQGPAQRGFEQWISTQHLSDYSRFLVSKGVVPDRETGRFSALAVSGLPLELSQPKFLEQQACDFIRKHQHEPFILIVAFVEPHPPYNGPLNDEHSAADVDVDLTAHTPLGADVPLRYRLMQEWQRARATDDPTGKRRRHFGITDDDFRSIKQRYLGLITLIDQSVGGILACVEKAELKNHTAIVFTSDHGDTLGAHQLFGKEVMYEEAVRAPYFVRLPGRRAGRVANLVSHIDFVPTMIDLLGQAGAEQCSGTSLLPVIRGESTSAKSVFIEWSPNRYAASVRQKVKKGTKLGSVRSIKRALDESARTVVTPDGWKLSLRDKDLNELYNLNDDPTEVRNLYYRGQHAAIISRCAAEIQRWQEATGDTLKLPFS